MSIRHATPATTPQFAFNADALREGVARSLGSSVALGCQQDQKIQELSHTDSSLIQKMNEPYRRLYEGAYPPPSVTKHASSIEYRSNAYMEHDLHMKIDTKGDGDNMQMKVTISTQARPIEDMYTGKRTTPPNMPVVEEYYRPTDSGCYNRLYQNAFNIEQKWTPSAADSSMQVMSGAPYFSAIGMALEAMLDVASRDFTGVQAMNNGGEVPLYNQVRFLITQYATAAKAFNAIGKATVLTAMV